MCLRCTLQPRILLHLLRAAMVLISVGSSEHVAHVWCKIGLFRKRIGFNDSLDVTKCLQKVEIPDLLHMCALVKLATILYKNHDCVMLYISHCIELAFAIFYVLFELVISNIHFPSPPSQKNIGGSFEGFYSVYNWILNYTVPLNWPGPVGLHLWGTSNQRHVDSCIQVFCRCSMLSSWIK